MQKTVQTCEFYNYRVSNIVPKRLNLMIQAINYKDFQALAEITIKQSNQLHAMCLDTYPSIIYMNQESSKLISRINSINSSYHSGEQQKQSRARIAYTMDAGTNIFLIYQIKDQQIVDALTQEYQKTINCVIGPGTQALNMKQLSQLYKYFTKTQ